MSGKKQMLIFGIPSLGVVLIGTWLMSKLSQAKYDIYRGTSLSTKAAENKLSVLTKPLDLNEELSVIK